MNPRPNRSDKYQYLIREVPCDFGPGSVVAEVVDTTNILYQEAKEEHKALNDALKMAVIKLAREVCTDRQWDVFQMLSQGKTQNEIAKELNVNQSSITKSLNGNVDYNNGRRVYGGLTKKLLKAIVESDDIRQLMKKGWAVEEEDSKFYLARLISDASGTKPTFNG